VVDEPGQIIPQLARGDVIGHKYEIEELLGGGLLGTTYRVKQLSTGKHLVLKFIHSRLVRNPKDRERLEQAFRNVRAIKHDGLLAFGELGDHGGTVYVTQEYAKGQSLRELMEEYAVRKQAFTLQEACQIVVKILDAVQVLHQAECYHRNLKPENIVVLTKPAGPGGKVVRDIKITDAGLSEILNPTLFADGYVDVSKAGYIAPEMSGLDQSGTAACDVYSVGVMLYELLVGQAPRGTYLSPTQLRGDLPDHIDDIVEVAIAGDALDRYPSAKDMMNDIQRSFQGLILGERTRTSFKSFMIGLAVALPVIGLAGLYVAQLDPGDTKADAQAQAAKQDQILRNQVEKRSHHPSEAELVQMNATHPDMLYIAPGPFIMGRLHQETGHTSEPVAQVTDVYGFYIDRYEFPNRTRGAGGEPVSAVARVTSIEAAAACKKVGKRLCTEMEWEKACKGPFNFIYSYGDEFDLEMCGKGVTDPHVLGAKANKDCVSGYSVADMSGNLREWTSTVPGTKKGRRVVKGGHRSNAERGSRCAFTKDERANYADTTLGFRCCLSLPDTPLSE
jgi:formylglycine-generating enzyme required for sulfatase activity/tRNA A-37 threonylcarbamoyl transferase component Bud32